MQVLSHGGITVPCADFNSALDWYCHLFGLQFVWVSEANHGGLVIHTARLVGRGDSVLELTERVPASPALRSSRPPIGHATFGTDDVLGVYERLTKSVQWHREPQRIETGPMTGVTCVGGFDRWRNLVTLWSGPSRWPGPAPFA